MIINLYIYFYYKKSFVKLNLVIRLLRIPVIEIDSSDTYLILFIIFQISVLGESLPIFVN